MASGGVAGQGNNYLLNNNNSGFGGSENMSYDSRRLGYRQSSSLTRGAGGASRLMFNRRDSGSGSSGR